MLDVKVLREQPDHLKKMLQDRGSDTSVVDTAVEHDVKKREFIVQADAKKSERNSVSKELGLKKKQGGDISAEATRMKLVSSEIKSLDAQIQDLDKKLRDIMEQIPNFPHSSVPSGLTDEDNLEVERWGEMREAADWELAHWDLGPKLKIMDFERASKICGSRFWLLRGAGARLERALINFMLSLHTCLLYTSPSPRDQRGSRMPSSA